MKRNLLSVVIVAGLVGTAYTNTANAGHREQLLQTQFRQMAEECQQALDQVPGYQLPKGSPKTLSGCYAHKVKLSFREAKGDRSSGVLFQGSYLQVPRLSYGRDRSRLLQAALQAEPTLAMTAYTAALQGRLNPYVAYTVASTVLPARSDELGRTSIAMGADPDRILAATAAGRSQE